MRGRIIRTADVLGGEYLRTMREKLVAIGNCSMGLVGCGGELSVLDIEV